MLYLLVNTQKSIFEQDEEGKETKILRERKERERRKQSNQLIKNQRKGC